MADIPTFQTSRLVLRAFTYDDVDEALRYHSHPEAIRYVPWPVRTREQVVEAIAKYVNGTDLEADGHSVTFGVALNGDGGQSQLIGQVLLIRASVEHRSCELGYVFNPDWAGMGYATEACRRVLRWAFEDLDVHRVIARIDARNTASVAVARRLGMRLEGHFVRNEFFKGEWTDELLFAILSEEWL